MKKLMTMIASVAMAFGLFAADPFAISFEQAEDSQEMGVNTTSMLFTPPVSAAEWSWTGDPLPLVPYEDGEVFGYGTGKLVRRDTMFADKGLVDNANYLSLKTGTEELTRAVGEGNMYLDQLVKFTGFEDPQTNLTADAKIAVWMSEFWNDDETEAETNLYVTVGKVDSLGNVEQIALKIHGTYELDTWYRISIKSLGDIYKGAEFTTKRAGFLVYVNGVQVYSDDIVARELAPVASMDGIAKSYMDNGLLFTSIAADDTFTSVSYKGIGAIDDVIIDAAGPEFCQAIPVTIVLPEDDEGNALITIDKVMVGGTVLPQPWEVPDNTEISVFFSPVNGKKITTGASPVVATITSSDSTVDLSDGSIVVEDVVAKLNDEEDIAESELAAKLTALTEGNEIAIVAACSILGDEDATLYSFTPNTKITGTADGWAINVAGFGEGETGNLVINADVAADFTLNVTLDDVESGDAFMFAGNVAGTLEANAVEVTDAITVSGTLAAEALMIDETITLSGAGKVETKSPVEDGQILGEDDAEIEPLPDTPEMGWTTYQIKQAPDTVEITFVDGENSTITPLAGVSNLVVGTEIKLIATPAEDYEFAAEEYVGWTKQDDGTLTQDVTIDAEATFTAPNATAIPYVAQVGNDKFLTAEAALTKVQELEANPDNFPITVTCLADQLTITIGEAPAQQSVTLAKNETIVITAGNWKFDAFSGNVVLAPGKTIKAKSLADGAAITTIPDYKVVKSDTTDEGGYYTWTVQAIEYATLAVDADEGITYTLTNKTTEAVVEAGYKADIDNAEVIEAIELAFEEGYELNAAASTTSVTLNTAETKTIVLKKQLKTFDITFTDAAEWTNVVSTAYGATPAPTELVPEKVGYTFTGWEPAIVAVNAAATYTAVYTVNEYDVTFSTNNIPVAEAATKVAHGATLEAIQIPTFTEEGTWDVDPATAVITCVTNFNYTISAAPTPDPVDPGDEKTYNTPEEAKDAADAINKNKEAMINVPTQASGDKAAYLALVAAKVVDGTKVVVDLTTDAETLFKGELDTEIKKADVAAALTDATADEVTIATKAGFYYWVEGGVEVGTIKTPGFAKIGTGDSIKLDKPELEATDKAFYKLAVGVMDPACKPQE